MSEPLLMVFRERFPARIAIFIAVPVKNVDLWMLPAVISFTTVEIDNPKPPRLGSELTDFVIPGLDQIVDLLLESANCVGLI
jgi:hypothetical protein